jgi:E3 ubiquitin-protein ligase HERC3
MPRSKAWVPLALVLFGCAQKPASSVQPPIDAALPDAGVDASPGLDRPADLAVAAPDASADLDRPDSAVDAVVPADRAPDLAPDLGPDAAAPGPDTGAAHAATTVVAGTYHTCALFDDGRVKCWGKNSRGAAGTESEDSLGGDPQHVGNAIPFVALGTGRTARALFANESNTCAILDDGQLKCWGDNGYGQLGIGGQQVHGNAKGTMGDALPAVKLGTGRTARSVAIGSTHSCALLDDARVKCWGGGALNADWSALGLGDRLNRGIDPASLGDALPAVDLGTGRTARAIAAGIDDTCAILDNGRVKCWGLGLAGALGLGDTRNRGDEPGEMGDNLPYVDLGTGRTATAIDCGWSNACALLDNGRIKCWGLNQMGQAGLGHGANIGDGPGEMGDALPYVDLGTGRTATALSVAAYHVCARLDDGGLKCWGANTSGKLGLGREASAGGLPNTMGDNLPFVNLGQGLQPRAMATGYTHSCALLTDGRIKCWGNGLDGQNGNAQTRSYGTVPSDMGDGLPFAILGGW